MTKTNNSKSKVPEVFPGRSFRRWIKQIFSNWMKHQSYDFHDEIESIHGRLERMEELIDVVAREVKRRGKTKQTTR